MKLAFLFLLCAASCFAQWAENKRRVEFTPQQLLSLHDAEANWRAAEDEAEATRARIRKELGEDDTHSVDLYDGYGIVSERTVEQ